MDFGKSKRELLKISNNRLFIQKLSFNVSIFKAF